jgi:Na+-driven multidrug efflux pump
MKYSHRTYSPVATWAMMGVIWEIFGAVTEGLGEAAYIRVLFYLTEGKPMEAKRLSNKVTFLAFILVLGVTSIFLMAGPNIAVALTTNMTIQHLFTQSVGLTGLANVSMSFSRVYGSLAGAQGRLNLASATFLLCRWLVILPMASICIYGYFFDLVSVAGAVAVGYAVAALPLAWTVFRCDWDLLVVALREEVEALDVVGSGGGGGVSPEGGAFEEENDDDDDKSSSYCSDELESSSFASERQSEDEDNHELL